MILALGQMPDRAMPLDAYPDYGLVGVIPVTATPKHGGLLVQRKSVKRTINREQPTQKQISENTNKNAHSKLVILDRNADILRDEEDLLCIVNAFLLIIDN